MSLDGHWTARYASVAGTNLVRESGGVVTFHSGKIVGGDTWTVYSGTYQLTGRQVALRVEVSIHFTQGGESILGGPLVPHAFVGLGELGEDARRIEVSAHVEGHENAKVVAILTKVLDF